MGGMKLRISIIIPTRDRINSLVKTIEAHLRFASPQMVAEIIVVDDGSDIDPSAAVASMTNGSGIRVISSRQSHRGPAAARNMGIERAEGEILLFTGDDIVPGPRMVEEHLRFHQFYNQGGNVAVLGKIEWGADLRPTPFMRYIQEYGLQFGFSLIEDHFNVPFNFFYTSNISIRKDFLVRCGNFDESFPYAAWEDIELSYRLGKAGLKIIYNEKALAYHDHRITFSSFKKRQERAGYAGHIFYEKHPELAAFLNIGRQKRCNILKRAAISFVSLFCRIAELSLPGSYSNLYEMVMRHHYGLGAQKRARELAGEIRG